jgi:hypothetical protein
MRNHLRRALAHVLAANIDDLVIKTGWEVKTKLVLTSHSVFVTGKGKSLKAHAPICVTRTWHGGPARVLTIYNLKKKKRE